MWVFLDVFFFFVGFLCIGFGVGWFVYDFVVFNFRVVIVRYRYTLGEFLIFLCCWRGLTRIWVRDGVLGGFNFFKYG